MEVKVKLFVLYALMYTSLGQTVSKLKKSRTCVCMEEIASNLNRPLIIENAADGTRRLFVGEQNGIIYTLFENGTMCPKPFLNITDKIPAMTPFSERGILGLVFHPDFKTNRKFFVYYSSKLKPKNEADDHVTLLSQFFVTKNDPNVADRSSEKVILDIQQPDQYHNGGQLIFGDDGFLYLFTGDGGFAGDPNGFAQNTSSLLGKVLRIDINNKCKSTPYVIPPDNPFCGNQMFRPEIFAYGFRNPWRCGKDKGDPKTGKGKGRIMCGDVGQFRYEEVNLIKKGGNFGWNSREGFECFNSETCGKIGPEVFPVFAYPHSVGKSVIGGEFYRGCLNPNLRSSYVFGDFMNGKLFQLLENRQTEKWHGREVKVCKKHTCAAPLTSEYGRFIMSFGMDELGEIYMVSVDDYKNPTSGKLYRIVDPRRNGPRWSCRATRKLRQKQLVYLKGDQ